MAYPDTKSQFEVSFTPMELHRRSGIKGKQYIPEWFRKKDPLLFRHIFWRLKMKMNTIILIVGAVRTGKSYLGLKMAEGYIKRMNKRDETGKRIKFDVKEQCSFDVLPFLKWSQTATESAYVLDECGITLSAQEWWTIQNRVFASFTQSQGFRRNLMILVLPNISFLNKRVRFLCNYIVETKSQGFGYLRKLVMNHTFGKGYPTMMGGIKWGLPTKRTIEYYENMKKVWNDKILAESVAMLGTVEEKKQAKGLSIQSASSPFSKLSFSQQQNPQILNPKSRW